MTEQDEVARLLARRDYSELNAEMDTLIKEFRTSGKISPYELCNQLIAVIEEHGWTIDEVRDHEKSLGIIWRI